MILLASIVLVGSFSCLDIIQNSCNHCHSRCGRSGSGGGQGNAQGKPIFEIGEEKSEASEKVEEGRIIRTDPEAGKTRKKVRKSIWLSHQASNLSN